jgi:hypothetical protein
MPKSSRQSIKDNYLEKAIYPERIYDELNEETIENVYEDVKIWRKEGENKSFYLMTSKKQ